MPEKIKTPNGGYYVESGLGRYTYYDSKDAYGIIKTEKEINEIMKMWTPKQWGIYYGIVLLCLIVFILLFIYVADSTVIKWIFGSLIVLTVLALIFPLIKDI